MPPPFPVRCAYCARKSYGPTQIDVEGIAASSTGDVNAARLFTVWKLLLETRWCYLPLTLVSTEDLDRFAIITIDDPHSINEKALNKEDYIILYYDLMKTSRRNRMARSTRLAFKRPSLVR